MAVQKNNNDKVSNLYSRTFDRARAGDEDGVRVRAAIMRRDNVDEDGKQVKGAKPAADKAVESPENKSVA